MSHWIDAIPCWTGGSKRNVSFNELKGWDNKQMRCKYICDTGVSFALVSYLPTSPK